MSKSRDFQGTIDLFQKKSVRTKKKQKAIEFGLNVPVPSMAETLISQFSDLGFSSDEKKVLTQKHRELIQCFRSIKESELKKQSQALIKELKTYKQEDLLIKAHGVGSYICLTAILSGKLPSQNQWRFELSETPLALFPKDLIKNKSAAFEFDISFIFKGDCWFRPFKNLYLRSHHMDFLTEQPGKDIMRKSA